ncbi:MAG: transposase [Kiritimatiellaeota bacterium]|nr:transposase [Kiritimatiellota bacterium]
MDSAYPQRQHLPHDRPAWVREDAIYFVTVCCEPRGQNQLCHAGVAERLFETVAFRQACGQWYAHLVLLMPDHVHALVSFPETVSMRKVLAEWKESAARRAGVHWQRDFFDHRLRCDEHLVEKANYIRLNPMRKGLVTTLEDWPYIWPPTQG